jgi:hypothetical protein
MLNGEPEGFALALQIYALHTAIEHTCVISPRSGNRP